MIQLDEKKLAKYYGDILRDRHKALKLPKNS